MINSKECCDRFVKVWNKRVHRDGADSLLNWLMNETDFFTAPASSRYHGSEEGGLCFHSLNVYYRLRKEYKEKKAVDAGKFQLWEYEDGDIPTMPLTDQEEEAIAIVALLHDLCKTNFYVVDYKNQKTYDIEKVSKASKWEVKHDNAGDFIWEKVPYYKVEDTRYYGHGECSVDLIRDFLKLDNDERLSIRWHMGFSGSEFKGGDGTVGTAFEHCPLAVLTHEADLSATYIDEARA